MEKIEVIVAHQERTTLRIGDVFLKIDTDQTRLAKEAEATTLAPIPSPNVLWHQPSVLAITAVPGTALGQLGEPSPASPAAWFAAGAAVRRLHEAPLPPWPGRGPDEVATGLAAECKWLIATKALPPTLVEHNRRIAETVIRPWTPVFTHGDLQVSHVFIDGDEVTGIIDWSEAGRGDALHDLAILTLGHPEHLETVLAGYHHNTTPGIATDPTTDLAIIRAWWSARSLLAARWLIEHGFDPDQPGCEFDVLRAQAAA